MLYCPHKDKIDPRELGLGKLQDDLDDDPVPVLAEVPRDQDPLGLHQWSAIYLFILISAI